MMRHVQCCCVLSFWILNAWEWNAVWSITPLFHKNLYVYKLLLFYVLPHKRKHLNRIWIFNLVIVVWREGARQVLDTSTNLNIKQEPTTDQFVSLFPSLVSRVVIVLHLSMHSIQLPIKSSSNNLHNDSNEHAKPTYSTAPSKTPTEWTIRR